MRKQHEWATRLGAALGVSKREGARVSKVVAQTIGDALAQGEKVLIQNVVSLEVTKRASRPARNPRTGEPATVPEHLAVRATTSRPLYNRLNT
jgi:nucleoid DNA-binding protein